jgi:hypothetical protein
MSQDGEFSKHTGGVQSLLVMTRYHSVFLLRYCLGVGADGGE